MNWWIDEARKRDPVGAFESYVLKLNGLFERRRDEYNAMREDALPPKIAKRPTKSIEQGRRLRVKRHTANVFSVQRLNDPALARVVDLSAPMCSCGYYDEFGIPCRHMSAAALVKGEHPKKFVVKQLRLETVKATYQGFIMPVDMTTVGSDGLVPPVWRKRPGRPKTKRIKSSAEKAPGGRPARPKRGARESIS